MGDGRNGRYVLVQYANRPCSIYSDLFKHLELTFASPLCPNMSVTLLTLSPVATCRSSCADDKFISSSITSSFLCSTASPSASSLYSFILFLCYLIFFLPPPSSSFTIPVLFSFFFLSETSALTGTKTDQQ